MSLAKVRDALVMMVGLLVVLWVIQVANWADAYRLNTLGIQPHNLTRLAGIFAAPFLHVSWQHIESNTVPLFVLGFLAAYRGVVKFLSVTLIVVVASGLTVWLFQSGDSVTVGASGLVFGYFGYVLVRGLFDRNWADIAVGAAAALMYSCILSVAVPGTPGISWLDHVGGLAGGVIAGWLLRAKGEVTALPIVSSHDQAYGAIPLDTRGQAGTEATG